MRWVLVTLLLLSLGATYPRHRRFLQKNLPAVSCTPYPETTNSVLWSQQYENAVWGVVSLFSADPVITANAATAPSCAQTNNITGCGAMTADRIDFGEIEEGEYSFVYQLTSCPAVSPQTQDVWLRGVSTSGVVNIVVSGGSGSVCLACNVSTEWTRCYQTVTNSGTAVVFGSLSSTHNCAAGTRAAFSVYAWNHGCTNRGTPPAPLPIRTTTAVVTRLAGCF